MPTYVYLILALCFSALTALVLLPWLLHLCYKNGIYDDINARKIHKKKIPRMGGMAFVPATFIGMMGTLAIMLGNDNFEEFVHTSTLMISVGIILIYFIGFLDDLFSLTANLKFAVQLIASMAFPLSGLYFNHLYGFMGIDEIPLWAGYAITVFITMLVVNAMNLIDGLDGLASGISLIALWVYTMLFYSQGYIIYCIFSMSLIGVLLVFIYFNIFGSEEKRTKTFMGDSGSLFLGFSLSYLGIKYAMVNPLVIEEHSDGILASYSVLIIPTFDLIRVAIRRKMRGGNMFEADKTHIHHKMLQGGKTPMQTLLSILGMDIFFIVLNFGLYHLGLHISWIIIVDVLIFWAWQLRLTSLIHKYEAKEMIRTNIRNKYEEVAKKAKKICILAPRFPLPENGGDVLRINNIARQLRKQGYKLVLVSFHDEDSPQMYEAQRIYHKIYTVPRSRLTSAINAALFLISGRPMQCGYYYSTVYKKLLQEVIKKEKPDLYISHLLRMTPYLEELQLEECSIIEMTDALSKTYSMSSGAKGGGILRIIYALEHNLIKRYEQHITERFPKCVLVSQADINYLKRLTTYHSSLELHANGVECMKKRPTSYNDKKICFIGNMRTLQNQDAVLFFVSEVFPKILQKEPETVLYLVGAQPPKSIQQLASENIIVTGFVDNLPDTISDVCVTIAPVRVASGIQNKVLVAMGCGLPVVMTTLIAQAIPELEDGKNVFIRDDASTIAEATIRIMRDPKLRRELSEQGYDMVVNHYSWKEKIRGYVI